MAPGIRAVSDICFKYIFGPEESTEVWEEIAELIGLDVNEIEGCD